MSCKYLTDILVIQEGEKIEYDSYYMMDYGIIYYNGHLHIGDAKMTVFVGWFDTTTELLEFYEKWKREIYESEMSKCLSLPVLNYNTLKAGKLIKDCELAIDGNGVVKLIEGIV